MKIINNDIIFAAYISTLSVFCRKIKDSLESQNVFIGSEGFDAEKLNKKQRELFYFYDYAMSMSKSILSFFVELRHRSSKGDFDFDTKQRLSSDFQSVILVDYHNLLSKMIISGLVDVESFLNKDTKN